MTALALITPLIFLVPALSPLPKYNRQGNQAALAQLKTLAEQVCRGPRCSGDTAIRVEPDGSVFPARGPFRAAGNLIEDDWESIEQSDVFTSYRQRVESDTHCDQCPGLAICAADCPREPAGWAEAERELLNENC